MSPSSARHAPQSCSTLSALLGRLRLRPASAGRRRTQRWFRPRLEVLEERSVPTVSILNGGGSGYLGNGGGGPPDVSGAAGPNSYIEVNNTITIFNKQTGAPLTPADSIRDFFFNPAIGNETQIDAPFSGQLIPIAASPTGATEAGNTVTITTTTPHGFSKGQQVKVSGVGVNGYNGVFTITGVSGSTFTYTDPNMNLANSGGGTASVDPGSCKTCDPTSVFDNLMGGNGRFIIGDIDVDNVTNVSQYIFAVSTSNNPTTLTKFDPNTGKGDWRFYHITTTETGAGGSSSWSDYPGNSGFNADAFVETFNMIGSATGGTQVVSVNASDLANGVSQASLHFYSNDVPGGAQDYRPTTMHDSKAGDPMWLVHNDGDGLNIHVVKMTNVLSSSASFDGSTSNPGTNLALPMADQFLAAGISAPLNPDGVGMFDVGSRILKAGENNQIIVAAHAVAVNTGSPNTLASAQPNGKNGNSTGGSGYTVGDTLTVVGGTFTTAAQLKVQAVNANGTITAVTVANAGSYTSFSGITGGVTGGTGTGASFALFFTGEIAVQWYAIDVSSGTPAFQQVGGSPNVGRVAFGANTYAFEPAIDINSSGQIGLGFIESDQTMGAVNPATKGNPSTFVTARQPTDPAGKMQPYVVVPFGKGTADLNGRTGDFSGMNVDPVNGTFWHVNEFGGKGGPTDIANFTPNAPPTVTPPADQTAVEGASKSFALGSFTDPDGGPWSVDINWGDGTSDTTFTMTAPGTIPSQSHTFGEEGTKTVTIKVTDNLEGQSDSKTFKVAVSDPAVLATGVPVSAVEGAAFTGKNVATFTDPGGAEANTSAHYKVVSIDWGDGTALDTTSGAISLLGNTFTVSGNHTYGEEGPYTVTVILDHEGVRTTVTTKATVSDPAVQASGVPVSAVEGKPFSSVATATFTDPGGAEPNPSDPSGGIPAHYTATIDWGDKTPASSAVITFAAGTFTVSGDHTYGEEGPYTITTTINHEGVLTTVQSKATVSDPAVMAAGVPVFAVECRTLTVPTATFTDPGGAEPNPSDPSGGIPAHYTASIDWGDSTPASSAVITFAAGTFTVSGSHAFAHEGTYTLTTTINHEGIVTVTTSTAVIKDDLGLLLLDPTGSKSLMVTGNGSVTANGCGAVVVDSNDSRAAFLTGQGTVTAEDIDVTGGVKTAGHGSFSTTVDHEAATPDPLGLSLPTPPSPTFAAVHYSGSAPLTLLPGTYIGGIDISGSGPVTLTAGVYYMQGGGFSVSGQGNVSGTGVTIINAPGGDGDTIGVSGQGSLSLTAPTSGPFKGVVLFQDPNSSNSIQFTGQASVTLAGVAYVPAAEVSIDGNANVTINPGPGTAAAPPPILGALIAYDLKVDGNGVLTINPDDPPSVVSPAVVLATPSSAGGGAVAFAALGIPVSGGSSAPADDSLVQTAILLGRSSPAVGNNPSTAPVAPSNTSDASPTIVDTLSSNNSNGPQAALSSASKGEKSNSSTATGMAPSNEQLVDAVFTSL